MATLTRDPSRGFQIRFSDANGKRRKITFGDMLKSKAEHYRRHFTTLERVVREGIEPSKELQAFLESLGPVIIAKLQAAGMIEVDEPTDITVSDLIERYMQARSDLKSGTKDRVNTSAKNFRDFIDDSTCIADITVGHAQQFRRFLMEKEYADTTVRKRCRHVSQFFAHAVDHELIDRNPFQGLPMSSTTAKTKEFIDHVTYARVIDACPNAEWRLLVALSRFGGLRVPSEALSLRWCDINWSRNEIRVPSPKTAHHHGRDCRFIPLWEELRQPLLDVQEQAAEKSEFVIVRARPERIRGIDPSKIDWTKINMGTLLQKIVKRAGLTPWRSIWHAMRASCQTELVETFPSHVVCRWLGNSQRIAEAHYLMTTAEHHSLAIDLKRLPKRGTKFGTIHAQKGTKNGTVAEPSAHQPEPQKALGFSGKNTKTACQTDVSDRLKDYPARIRT